MFHALPYGRSDFDPEIVAALFEGHHDHVSKERDGGMTCPLVDHRRERLHWQDGDYARGTVPHGRPEVAFRVSPTYILSEPRDNLIAGADLIGKILDGTSGKAETFRFGHENSEDALSWNVLRSLQEAGLLHALTPLLCDYRERVEPVLYLWGRRIDEAALGEFAQLGEARQEFEPAHRRQTEPDIVLRLPGWGWVFIEAKFGSPVTTARNAEKMDAWLRRYAAKAPHLIDLDKIANAGLPPHKFPEQLLRNAVFASWIAAKTDERAHVVLLARRQEITPVEDWLADCLTDDARVTVSRLSWEEIYAALPPQSSLATLRSYLEGKTHSLRPAFEL
jgi:Restriction Endonuclease associating with ARP